MEKSAQSPAMAIDMGERHHLAIVTDCPGFRPILVPNTLSERDLLRMGRLARKAPRQFRTEMAELSRFLEERCQEVVQTCLEWGIRSVAIGNRSIQNPYRVRNRSLRENPLLNLTLQIIHTLRFQCALSRIDTQLVDESFTSQVDALCMEPIEYAGSRKARRHSRKGHLRGKVYHSETGQKLDRDINAAINIGRVVFGNTFAEQVLTHGNWKDPVLLNWGARDCRTCLADDICVNDYTPVIAWSPALEEYLQMGEDPYPGLVSYTVH